MAASRVDIDPEAQDALERAAEAKRVHRRELVGLAFNALSTGGLRAVAFVSQLAPTG